MSAVDKLEDIVRKPGQLNHIAIQAALNLGCTNQVGVNAEDIIKKANKIIDNAEYITDKTKRVSRERTISSMKTESGNAYGKFFVGDNNSLTFAQDVWERMQELGWRSTQTSNDVNTYSSELPKKQDNHPHNRLLYGAPGTGKSYLLKQQTDAFASEQVERVTFHPEYTYFDFVGSYKPVMVEQEGKEVIAYRFEAGPFAKILKKALAPDGSKYVLVIEEINRARAAAVFGDLFQLLDRDSEGRSEYGITPARDLANYLTRDNEDGDGVELENGKLYLPDNLYIWATMNSADQGVFPLDTAFKRRWSFEYIPIDNNEDKITGPCSAKWNEIRKHVNKLLQEAGINEDKQMGAFFLKGEELATERNFLNAIKEKVIMYLYEDAARHQRGQIFKNERARFSELCNIFDGTIASIFREAEGEALG